MKTLNKTIIAAAVATVIGGVTVAGMSFADDRRHGMRKHHDSHESGQRKGRGHYSSDDENGNRDNGRSRRGHGAGRLLALLKNADADGDGKLTADEIAAARGDRFSAFDSDDDGQLALEEFQALWLDGKRGQMVDRFQALDEDGDSVITATEYSAPLEQMVARLDRNADGEITSNEMRRR